MRPTSFLARLFLAAPLWLGLVTLAFAHAALTGSEPEDGVMLAAPPAVVRLSFSEAVRPLVVTLVRPDGATSSMSVTGTEDGALSLAMPAGLGTGTHLISWRVVSSDGHPVGGVLTFSIRRQTAMPADPADDADLIVDTGLWATKLALYLAVFFGLGGAVSGLWFGHSPLPARRLCLAFTALGLIAGLPAIAFQGLDALGAPFSSVKEGAIWTAAFETSFARTVAVIAACCLLVLLAQAIGNRIVRQSIALLSLSIACMALAMTGHAASAAPQWLTRPAVFIHALAIALWLGALPPLAFVLFRSPATAAAPLRRFSAFIPAAIAALIASGACLAIIQVGRPAALLTTAYGQILLAKLLLLVILLALAAYNRWRLTAPTLAEKAHAAKQLARIVLVETILATAILGLAAGWRLTPPPRVLAIAAAEPISVHMHGLAAMADVTITPGHDGPVTISAIIMTGDFGPLDARSVGFTLTSHTGRTQAAIAYEPGDGTWRADGVILAASGKWTLGIDIRAGDQPIVLKEEFTLNAYP